MLSKERGTIEGQLDEGIHSQVVGRLAEHAILAEWRLRERTEHSGMNGQRRTTVVEREPWKLAQPTRPHVPIQCRCPSFIGM